MDFKERLDMYLEGEFINKNDVDNINKIIKIFKDKYGIVLEEENAGMFIAHLCAAYSRINNNDEVEELPDEILDDVKKLDSYPRSLEMLKDIEEITPLSETEEKYVLLHLNNMLGTNNEQ